jgi:two-component system, NtrC family, nitrogen regulation sensor histidine kinase NtrY
MNRLRNKLVLLFLGATILPVLATFALTMALFNLSLTPARDLDSISRSLEQTGKSYYQQAHDTLRDDAATGKAHPKNFSLSTRSHWPDALSEFWDGGEPESFSLTGNAGNTLEYYRREPDGVAVYIKPLKVGMESLTQQYRKARSLVEKSQPQKIQGFTLFYIIATALIWMASAAGLIYIASRISRPMEQLTAGLQDLAAGNFDTRIEVLRHDEVGRATAAFNHTARQLEQNRDRLVYLTQLASWQVLARKMAHEVKNSLTPIRLTVEEMVARGRNEASEPNRVFLEQAAQIVVDEVESLGRRVRAFSELSSEPPVRPANLDINAVLEERISFLKAAHPEVSYIVRLAEETPSAMADEDLVKSILVNLLENAAEAAGTGGRILAFTKLVDGRIAIEVHDSGPGLSEQARVSLFQPTISFKKRGMGIGLSIARKGALLSGGDIQLIHGELGGAAFRVILPAA